MGSKSTFEVGKKFPGAKILQSLSFQDDKFSERSLSFLKRGVWLYFLLLIFEGALRKWVLPGLAAPLLVIRDPIAIWIIFSVWNRRAMPNSLLLKLMIIIAIFSFFTALFVGHGNFAVALFGARIWLIHFPLIFAIGRIFDKDDVLKIGKFLLWLSIPMCALIAMQFYSPQSAWVNRGVGGDVAGAGFSGALGFFRPPATFSFTIGTHLFFGMVGSFLFYFWLNPKFVNKISLYVSTLALIIAIPLSISRSLAFFVLIALFFAITPALRKPSNLIRIAFAAIAIFIGISFLSDIPFFKTATAAFTDRFTTASDQEGGLSGTLGDRYLGGMLFALSKSIEQPFFGYGLGMGTNVGSQLLTGERLFLISEEEWGRVIGEQGTILGLSVIFIRVAFCLKYCLKGFSKMNSGDMLPWMMLSFGLLVIPQGQWAQPTYLGFGIISGGFIIASFKTRNS